MGKIEFKKVDTDFKVVKSTDDKYITKPFCRSIPFFRRYTGGYR